MAITRTALLDLPIIATGTESGVWGDITNNGLTQYLDISIAGRTSLTSADFTAGALTISTTEGDASATNIVAGSAQYATLYVSSLAANSTITAPSSNRAYRVFNADSTYTLTIKAAGQTGVTFPVNTSGTVVFNGTDYVLLGTFFNTATVISVTDNTNAALRITQLGTGNALLVEDSANPDATPFVIDALGSVITGYTQSQTISGAIFQYQMNGANPFAAIRWNSSNSLGLTALLGRSRSGTVGVNSLVSANDVLGTLTWAGDDGTAFVQAASIATAVDGTPGTNDMPGRLLFSTTADGATTPTERMRITNAGNALIGGTAVRGTTVGSAHLDIFNGTAPAGTLTNGISLYSSSGDFNFMDSSGNGYKVGYRNVPAVGTKTGSYTLTTADVGEYVQVGSGGSITIPNSTFAEGDVISVFNNTSGNITITCTITTAYIAGTDSDKASVTLATRGIASILFISGTVCVITGNVS